MKISNLFLAIFLSGLAISCGDDVDVNIQKGTGSIVYDNQSYPLNYFTLVTYSTEDGLFDHDVIITNTSNGNTVFSFTVVDEISANAIQSGEYEITLHGNNRAHFALSEETGDSLTGILTVEQKGNQYSFHFEGITVDERVPTKEVSFSFRNNT